ncbi:hypothetical protein ACO0LL_28145 [Undibacterium sp. TC4M20W]|uniref:hypothetical protein n=1 Tax=unclassified Undibacterium TaxID=2630295 RepID=UPI003BF0843B
MATDTTLGDAHGNTYSKYRAFEGWNVATESWTNFFVCGRWRKFYWPVDVLLFKGHVKFCSWDNDECFAFFCHGLLCYRLDTPLFDIEGR